MARNTDPDAKIRDIVRRKVTESAHRVINRIAVRGANVRIWWRPKNLEERQRRQRNKLKQRKNRLKQKGEEEKIIKRDIS